MNEWVFVTERFPEKGKKVVVYGIHAVYVGGGKHFKENIATGRFEDGEWDVYYPVPFQVIAWMDPQPPLPKGGE